MAKFNESRKLKLPLQKFKKEAPKLVDIMLTDARNFFEENFRKQGFDNNSVEKWQPRKRSFYNTRSGKRVDDTNRAILVKSGRLRRSLRKKRLNAFSGLIFSEVPYAKIHNEGGEINRAAEKRLMYYREVATNIATRNTLKRFARTSGIKSRKATHAMEVDVAAYKIKIRKRQFVGYSEKLNKKLRFKIESKINNIFA